MAPWRGPHVQAASDSFVGGRVKENILLTNKALVRRWFDEVLTRGDIQRANEIFSPSYVLHDSSFVQEVHGREGVKRYVTTFHAASPDLCFAVEDQIGEGDMVVTRWIARGTHREEFLGIPPTGNQMTVTGIEFDRVIEGKIDEAWICYHLFNDSTLDFEQVKRVLAMMQDAFPDLCVAEADSVTEGNKVAFRWIMSGTHEGELMGVTPTGERITVMGIDIVRVEDDEILDYWGEFDVMSMLRQLGITPPPK
jgi:steroid delta-isomerase-like uncharacterized protein